MLERVLFGHVEILSSQINFPLLNYYWVFIFWQLNMLVEGGFFSSKTVDYIGV